jgi:hypothetical protein
MRKEKGTRSARRSSNDVQEVAESENGIRRAAKAAAPVKSERERKSNATYPDTNRYAAQNA